MSRVVYRNVHGLETTLEVASGTSVMQAAVSNGVQGIVAECGGQLMCATCHVYVEHVDGELPVQQPDERDMLELAAAPVEDCSRLSCQLVLDDAVASVLVRLPEIQV